MTAKDKAILGRIHDKYYGKGSKAQQENAKDEKVIKGKKEFGPSPKEGIVMHAGVTRNELMMQCKAKGVKNFRVLNKEEMVGILAHIGDQKFIDAAVSGAVARWKQGWGKGQGGKRVG